MLSHLDWFVCLSKKVEDPWREQPFVPRVPSLTPNGTMGNFDKFWRAAINIDFIQEVGGPPTSVRSGS